MAHLEIGHADRYVLAVEGTTRLEPWLQEGFTLMGRYERLGAFAEAMQAATLHELEPLWREVVGGPMPENVPRRVIDERLQEETYGDEPRLLILTRLIVSNFLPEPVVYKPQEPTGPQRLSTDHYVVIETVDEKGHAVPSIRCELVIAGGEVRTVSTGPAGVVRVDRIQAGRVIIRVVDLDGGMWHPQAGEAAQMSGGSERSRVHVVRQGECLSKIAHQYGIKGWKSLWDDPKNEKLRKKRKSPHVLHPGDEVVVPGTKVHEIVRVTDATHRIVVTESLVEFRVILQDHNQLPFVDEPYELRVDADAEPRTGSTDAAGKVVEQLSADVRRVEVRLLQVGLRWTFALSSFMDRPGDDAAVQQGDKQAVRDAVMATQLRLNALGFPCGETDGKMGPKTHEALALLEQQKQPSDDQPAGEVALAALDRLDPMFTGVA